MAIITVAHAAFTGGTAIAEKLAAALNYRCVDREVSIEASRRYGIPEAKFEEVLETQGHWWERWLEGLRLYRITLQAAMCEVAQNGNLVYHGRGGQELFPGIKHVLKVLIVSSMDVESSRCGREEDWMERMPGSSSKTWIACAAAACEPCSTSTGRIRPGTTWC